MIINFWYKILLLINWKSVITYRQAFLFVLVLERGI